MSDVLVYLATRLQERAGTFPDYPIGMDENPEAPVGEAKYEKWVRIETEGGRIAHLQHPGTMRRLAWRPRFVCVSRTKDGLRDLIGAVRKHFDLYRLDPSAGATPLREDETGPDILAGDTSDRRWSCTLVFELTTSAADRED